MTITRGIVASAMLAAVAMAAATPAAAQISSTFDTNNQGWQVGDVASTTASSAQGGAIYILTGGNSGGYIFTNDVANEVGFIAPAAYTGDLSTYHGGTASFDTFDGDGSDSGTVASIIL